MSFRYLAEACFHFMSTYVQANSYQLVAAFSRSHAVGLPVGEAEGFSVPGGGQKRAAETVGLRGGAEARLPQPASDLPAHFVRGDLAALVDLGPVDPGVVGDTAAHQAASSREASQRWYSDLRTRRLPFGSVMHRGARFFARHS